MPDQIAVSIHQEDTPARQWVVELQKPGGRLTVYRGIAQGRQRALGFATALAEFLGVPLITSDACQIPTEAVPLTPSEPSP